MAKSFNPFSVFRKNQKVALALITLLSMFAFVCVAPSMMGSANNGPANPNSAVVATWNYGEITRLDVNNRLRARNQINRFLRSVWAEAARLGKVDPATSEPQQFEPVNDDGAIQAIVLEKKAELLGMSVSDQYVNDYIDAVSNGALSRDEKDTLLNQATGNQRGAPSQLADQFFENMRFELLARNFYRLLTSDAIDYDTPEQRWNNFSRLYRQATVQVLPVAVKDFTSKISNPENRELQDLFDKYKDRLAQPELPDPGFMVPARAKFQYFKAVRETLAKADEAKVTDAEINDYYEKNKERFRKLAPLDESFPSSETPKAGESPKSEPKSAPATGKPNAQATTEKPKPATAPPTTPANPAPVAPPARTAPKSGAATKTPPVPNSNTPAGSEPKAPTNKSSLNRRMRRAGDEELLALADTTPPTGATPASKPATGKTSAIAAAPATSASAKTPPATTPSPTAVKSGDRVSDGLSSSEIMKLTTPASPAAAKANPPAPASEYDSVFDPKVRKQIRQELGRDKATGEIKEAFQKLSTEVSRYNSKYMLWAAAGSEGAQPEEPDFKATAKAYGMTFEQTGSMSAEEAKEKSELGNSTRLQETPQLRVIPFVAIAFDPNVPVYHANDTDSADEEFSFLWWKTDFQPAYVPNFSDAKPDVLKAWKFMQARTLALKEAKAHADEANRRRATLKEIFQNRANMSVSEVGPFHWLTMNNVSDRTSQPQISLTRLDKVDMAGLAFMEATFKTEVGSATAAFNQPQTIAYVIQLQKLDPTEDVFRSAFQRFQIQAANTQNPGTPILAARAFAGPVAEAKIRSIFAELGLQRVAGPTPANNTSAAPSDTESQDED